MAFNIVSHPIRDLNVYEDSMSKSINDKLFWLDHIDIKNWRSVVDFGCADGTTLIELNKLVTGRKIYIGYDIMEEQLKRALENSFKNDRQMEVNWTNSFRYAQEAADAGNSLLMLNSLIHEVYSYCDEKEINLFWGRVLSSGFKYITVRDMAYFHSMDYYKFYPADYCRCDKHQLNDYDSYWGDLSSCKGLTHFLLKVHYKENWERELRENYFPLSSEEIINKFTSAGYKISYQKEFTLPYLNQYAEEEFGIIVDWPTHLKLICEKG